MLNLATWAPCTRAEGPGARFALWVQGCPIRCPGCCNPEMFSPSPHLQLSVDATFAMILDAREAHAIEGVSLLGGEPLAQARPLADLAEKLQQEGLSVMLFSGYRREEIETQGPDALRLLQHTDILVDGRYEAALHTKNRRWIGSTNQRIHFLSDRYDPQDPQWQAPNNIEFHFDGQELIITGFPEGPWKKSLEAWRKRQTQKRKNRR